MPTVPRRGLGYVPTTATPTVNPAGAFTPPQPIPIAGAFDQIQKMVEQHQQHADQVALLDADNQLSSLSTNLETQTLSRHGKDALAAGPEVQDAWTKGASDISGTLTNDRQREAFQERADHHWQLLNETVQKHGAAEYQKYDADNTSSALQNRLTDSVNNYQDPTRLNQNLAESKDLVALYGNRNGESPETIQEKAQTASSAIHTGVIDRMLTDGNDITAKTYFDSHKSEMTANDILRVEGPLEIGSTLGKAQRNRDQILKTTTNEADAVAAARTIDNPREQAETERLIRSDYTEKAQALREQKEQIMTSAAGTIEKTHSFDAIPPSTIATMTVQERTALREYADKLSGGGAIKTNLSKWYDLQRMATTPETRDKFLQLDLNNYKADLSPSDFEEMAKLQASVRKGEDKPLAELYTRQQTVARVLKSIGIGVNPKKRKQDEPVIAEFQRQVNAQVDLFQEGGKKATTQDVERIANDLAAKHVVERPGWLWGTNKEDVRTFQMQSGEQILGMTIKDVPSSAKIQIRAALGQRGKAVTDQAVVDAYRAYVQTLPPEQ